VRAGTENHTIRKRLGKPFGESSASGLRASCCFRLKIRGRYGMGQDYKSHRCRNRLRHVAGSGARH
jgi:hypothetical protein